MADRTIKPDDTNDLVLQNNDGSAKLELNEDQTVKVTGNVAVTGSVSSTVSGGSNAIFDKSTGGSIAFKQGGTATSLIEDLQSSGGIGFYTGTGGSLTKHIEMTNTGSIKMFTSGQGIDFSQSQTHSTSYTPSSELFSHYEEGQWTPTISGVSVGSGNYTRIGRICLIEAVITANGISTDQIDGLPFHGSLASGYGGVNIGRMMQCDVLDSNGVPCRAMMTASTIRFRENITNANDSLFTITTASSGTVRLGITGFIRM